MANGAILGQTANTYSKEQIMASTVPPLYGLGPDAVPSDVLGKLNSSVLYSESKAVEDRTSDITCAYVNALGSGYASKTAPSYDAESGEYKFSGQTYRCTGAAYGFGDDNQATSVKTSWAYITLQNDSSLKYYIPDDAKNTYVYIATVYAASGSDGAYFYPEKLAKLYEKITVVDSKLKTVLGDLIYVPANQIYGGVKLVTGTYTGTGTYGSSNPNSLTFEFEPKAIFIQGEDIKLDILIMIRSTLYTGKDTSSGSSTAKCNITWGSNTVSWYSNSETNQSNDGSIKYYYIAIG